jgi:hypothetical protein
VATVRASVSDTLNLETAWNIAAPDPINREVSELERRRKFFVEYWKGVKP